MADVFPFVSIAVRIEVERGVAGDLDFLQVAFTPDGRHLITANGNGTIYVLRLKEFGSD